MAIVPTASGIPETPKAPSNDLANRSPAIEQPAANPAPQPAPEAEPVSSPAIDFDAANAPPKNEYDDILDGKDQNPYDAIVDQERTSQKSAIQSSMYAGTSVDPDRRAQVIELSKKTNIPENIVERNFDIIARKHKVTGTDYDSLIDNSPGLAKWLEEPKNAAIAHDDIGNLQGVERSVQDYSFTDSMLQSLKKGAASLGGTLARAPGVALDAIIQKKTFGLFSKNDIPLDNLPAQYFEKKAADIKVPDLDTSIVKEIGAGNYKKAGRAMAAQFFSNAPNQAAIIATGIVGGPAAGLMLAGTTSATQKYEENLKAGVDPRKSMGSALITGSIEASFERLGTFGILRSWENAIAKQYGKQVSKEVMKDFAKTLAYSVAAEANEEALTSAAQDFTDYLTGVNPNALEGIGERALNAGIVGGFSGGVLTSPSGAASGVARVRQGIEVQNAKDFYASLGESSIASKLRARLPGAKRQFVESITKDSPVEHIYIPVDDAKAYFQGKGQNLDEIAKSLGVSEALDEAVSTGGDIKIPLSTWVEKVVGTEHWKGLENDVKFSPDSLTPREIERVRAEAKSSAQSIEQDLQAQESKGPDPETQKRIESASKIFTDIQGKLKEAGLTEQEVRFDPKIHEAFFSTIGEQLGVDPYELQQRFPLEVRRFDTPEDRDSLVPDMSADSPEGASLLREVSQQAKQDRLAMARRAIEAIPDVSTDAVAEALGLPKNQVRLLGNKGRRKGKAVETNYSQEEILAAAGASNEQRSYNQESATKPADITLDYTPNKNDLTRAQRAAEENLGRILSQPDAAEKYAALEGTYGGKLLDTDIARSLSPEYASGRDGAVLHTQSVHAPAGQFIWNLYKEKLKAPPTGEAVLMGGGPGSGKTEAFDKPLAKIIAEADVIYDGTGQRIDDQIEKIEMALDSGRPVRNAFVYLSVEEAAKRAAIRFKKSGRTIPPEQFVEGHVYALDNFLALVEKYKDTKGVKFQAFDNTRDDPIPLSLEKLNELRYNKNGETVEQAIKRLLPMAKEVLREAEEEVAKARDQSRTPEEVRSQSRTFFQHGTGGPQGSQGAGSSRTGSPNQAAEAGQSQLVPPFYSKLTKTVEEKMGGSATPAQINGMLKEIKPEERKWLGVDEFLKGKEKVTKQEFLDFLRANAIDIKEVTKGAVSKSEIIGERERRFIDFLKQYGHREAEAQDIALQVARGEVASASFEQPSLQKAASELRQAYAEREAGDNVDTSTKFSKYTLPGGENYREVLFTLPPRDKGDVSQKFQDWAAKKYGDKWLDFSDKKLKEIERDFKNQYRLDMQDQLYRSSHFDEPNVLAHTRLNDRVDADGKRVLFVEEIQSDWHQEGRKKGYQGELPAGWRVEPNTEGTAKFKVRDANNEMQGYGDTEEEAIKMATSNSRSAVPSAPFKKNWHEFVFKRLIREAAEKGYDRIAWTTGEQQADRYDLAKQVDEVQAKKNKDGTYKITVIEGDSVLEDVPSVREQDLEAQLGKDLAAKIIAQEGKETVRGLGIRSYTGVDLKVGGEGMKGFYDKILVEFANKFGKKFGAKVGETQINIGQLRTMEDSIDKVRWPGGKKETIHSLEITPALKKAALEEGFSLFQGGGEGPRGQITFGGRQFNIDLFKGKDRSTFLHESGHFFLEVMGEIVEGEGKGSESLQRDYKAILDWFGVRERSEITTEMHEKFARGFEQYLSEGNAPSLALRDAFSRFRKWLTSLWKKVSFQRVEVSPEIRDVFDRMLATEEQIAEARASVNLNDLEIEGLDKATKEKIRTLQERARNQAEETLLKERLGEMKSDYREKLAEERKKFREAAEEQVRQEPLFQAMEEIKGLGKKIDPYKFAEAALRGELSVEQAAEFELISDQYGYQTAQQMAEEISQAGADRLFESKVDAIVDDNLRQVGLIKDAQQLREEALRAIHSEQTAELLALEREALVELAGEAIVKGEARRRNRVLAKAEAEAATAEAKRILANKPAAEAARPQVYMTQERNAAARVARFLAKKDYTKAAEAKKHQLMAHALVRESFRINEEVDKHFRYLQQFTNRGQGLLDMPFGFVRQIDAILARYGLQDARKEDLATLQAIAQQLEQEGKDPNEIANATGLVIGKTDTWVPETLPDFIARQNENYHAIIMADSIYSTERSDPKTITLESLRDLREAVQILVESGRKHNRFLSEFIKVDTKAAAAEIRNSIEGKIGAPRAGDFVLGAGEGGGIADRVKSILNLPDSFIPSMVNVETLANFLDRGDPNGPVRKFIYRIMSQAEDRKQALHEKAVKEMNMILEKHYTPSELAAAKVEKRMAVRGFKDALTKENILAIALNWGNQTNRDRVLMGYNVDATSIQEALNTLEKRDWDFVQDTWNYLDTYWPEIAKLEMKVKGVEPKKVMAAKVVTKFGVYEGGYYPIAYDFNKSAEAHKMNEQRSELFKQYSAAAAHTERGHAEARVARVKRPVRLSLGVMFDHLENVIHDISYREAVIDVNRLLRENDVKTAIQNAIGLKGFLTIDNWLRDIASDQRQSMQDGEQFLRWFRMKATMSTLSFRAFTVPMDLTGNVINGIHEIGPARMFRAIADHLFGNGASSKDVVEKSTYMRQRENTMDRDLADLNRRWQSKPNPLAHFAFFFQRFSDDALAKPLWKEVYRDSLGKYDEETAIQMANEAVKRTLGSGSAIDLVGAQRGSEFKKILTMYYSWASMMFNRAWLEGKIAGLEYREGNVLPALAVAARGAFFLWFAQAINENFWREILRNSAKGESEEEKKKRILGRFLMQPFGYVWLGRDIAGGLIDYSTGQHGNIRLSPIEQAAETMFKPVGKGVYFAFTDHKKFDAKFLEDSAKATSMLLGAPQTLNNMAFNFVDWAHSNGELTWKDALSRRQKK